MKIFPDHLSDFLSHSELLKEYFHFLFREQCYRASHSSFHVLETGLSIWHHHLCVAPFATLSFPSSGSMLGMEVKPFLSPLTHLPANSSAHHNLTMFLCASTEQSDHLSAFQPLFIPMPCLQLLSAECEYRRSQPSAGLSIILISCLYHESGYFSRQIF